MAGVDATNLVGRVRGSSLDLGGSLGLLGRHDEIWLGLLCGLEVCLIDFKVDGDWRRIELKMISTDRGTSFMLGGCGMC